MKNNIMYHWKVFVMFLSSSTLYNVQCTFCTKYKLFFFMYNEKEMVLDAAYFRLEVV